MLEFMASSWFHNVSLAYSLKGSVHDIQLERECLSHTHTHVTSCVLVWIIPQLRASPFTRLQAQISVICEGDMMYFVRLCLSCSILTCDLDTSQEKKQQNKKKKPRRVSLLYFPRLYAVLTSISLCSWGHKVYVPSYCISCLQWPWQLHTRCNLSEDLAMDKTSKKVSRRKEKSNKLTEFVAKKGQKQRHFRQVEHKYRKRNQIREKCYKFGQPNHARHKFLASFCNLFLLFLCHLQHFLLAFSVCAHILCCTKCFFLLLLLPLLHVFSVTTGPPEILSWIYYSLLQLLQAAVTYCVRSRWNEQNRN